MDKYNEFISDGKIAIMGGTFDPIHYGHLASAETVRCEYGFKKIVFIPSGIPAHKSSQNVTESEKRYLMTSHAIASNNYFDISRIEIERTGNTYTLDTIKEITEITGKSKDDIYFITGADAVLEILNWYRAEELLKICSFIAITRPGYNLDKLKKQLDYLQNEMQTTIKFVEVPALAISSTDIRRRVKSDMPIKYLVPDNVEEFINKYGLYRG